MPSGWVVLVQDDPASDRRAFAWIVRMARGNIAVLYEHGRFVACVQSGKTRAKRVFARGAEGDDPLNLTHKPTKAVTSWNAGSIASRIFARLPPGTRSADTSF